MGARETALRVLMSCRNNHAWADAALKAQLGRDGLVGAEAALCSRIGLRRGAEPAVLLDFYLGGVLLPEAGPSSAAVDRNSAAGGLSDFVFG